MSGSLSNQQQATLSAAADRIVPADSFPAAGTAGAADYIQRLLNRDMPHRWAEFVAGLERLSTDALAAHGLAFVELTAPQQDEVLEQQDGSSDVARRRFFAWLVELVLEGYYADPANGGNAGAASWRMVGYDPNIPGYDGSDGNSNGKGGPRG